MVVAKDEFQDGDFLTCVGTFLHTDGIGTLNFEDSEKHIDFTRSLARFSGGVEGRQGGDLVQTELKVGEAGDGGGVGILYGGARFLRLVGALRG